MNHDFIDGQCVCGAVFETEPEPTVCQHWEEFLEYFLLDETAHEILCKNCGEWLAAMEDHSFNGVDGKCKCGYEKLESTECPHPEEFLTFTKVDSEYHTALCGNCGAVVRHIEAHDFGFAGDQCVCGAMGCPHWDEWWVYRPKDEYSHYVDCSNCGMVIDDKMGHEFSDGVDSKRTCICGYVECSHMVVSYTPVTDGHHVLCDRCDYVLEEAHEFVDGVCVCGEKKKTEPIENPFKDVKKKEYYYDSVLWAVSNEITNGMTSTEFMPDKICTRGQIVTFLWRAKGQPEPESTENPFKDVKKGDYFYKAVLWAVEEGITNGTGKGVFSPNADCTRGQVATFLWRSMDEPAPNSQKHNFKDIKKGEYYYDAVLWAVEHGVTNGTSATTFAPNSPCTRGQIVTFLYRALN